MPWVKFKLIDEIKIVTGFGGPGIDPEATKKRVIAELEVSPEFAEYRKVAAKISKQVETVTKRRAEAEGSIKRAGNGQGRHVLKKRKAEKINAYQKCNSEIQRYHGILSQALDTLAVKKQELLKTCVVLLSGGGYELVDVDTHEALQSAHKALKPHQYVTKDGTVIDDLRGVKYLVKIDGRWDTGTVKKFGDVLPAGAKRIEQLTDNDHSEIMEQGKRDMIADLEPDDRAKMLEQELDVVALQAALRRSAYELSDHKDPTGAAKEWLQAQQAKIKEVYDVSG